MVGWRLITVVLVLGCVLGGSCAPTVPPPLPATAEQEPNDALNAPQKLDLAGDSVRVTGTIGSNDDIDLYSLGELQRGDRVTITLDGTTTDAQLSLVLFEVQSDQALATLLEATTTEPGAGGTVLDSVIRQTGTYTLGVIRRFGSIEPGGNYDATASVQHGVPVPNAAAQIVLLDFAGGAFVAPDGVVVTIGSLDPGAINPSLAGSSATVLDTIAATVRTNFAGYGVQILRSDQNARPTDQPFSTVFFGPVLSGEGSLPSDGLGVAVHGVDSSNKNHSDVAIVLSQLFTPDLFGVPSVNADQVGTALGNVASHEIGHLLGLQHVFDPTDVMNTLDSPGTLLQEQRFKRSTVHFFIFDTLETLLTQDGPGQLIDLVGSTRRPPDLELTAGQGSFAISAADIDVEGGVDLAVADHGSSTVSVFGNLGNRAFTEAITLDVGGKPIDVVALETEFVSEPSIITVNPSKQNLSIFYLTSNGFAGPANVTAGTLPRAITVGDWNGDFNLDLAVANFESNDVTILLSDGFGGFVNVGTVAVGQTPQGVVTADFDGDGRQDLAVTNSNDNTVSVLKGAGNGGFTALVTLPAGTQPTGIIAADLNKDGKVDLAVASILSAFALVQYSSSVCVFINQGNGQFAPQAIYSVEAGAEQIEAADLNGDGFIDLATANSGDPSVLTDGGSVSLLLNRGNGTFGQDIVLQAGIIPSDLVIGDFDGRGLPDIAVANRGSGTVSVYFNE